MKIKLVFLLLLWSVVANAQNLIQNPDCELPLVTGKIPFWDEKTGEHWTQGSNDPSPQSGQSFFFAGVEAEAELTQTIPVDEYSCSIDRNNQNFQFTAYVRSFAQDPPDQSQIIIEMLTSNNSILRADDLGTYSTTNSWVLVFKLLSAPAQTRKIRIRLLSHRRNGADNDGYFDNLSLVPLPSVKNIKIASVSSTSASCNQSDGSLAIIAIGGTGAIRYSLDGQSFQSSNTFSSLAGGVYTVTVSDQSSTSCSASQSVTVTGGSSPRIERVIPSPASCDQPNGAVIVTATGGTRAIRYSLDGQTFQTSNIFIGLAGGVYTVTVKDHSSASCTASQRVTVASTSGPRIDQLQPTAASCNQRNGIVSVTSTGGTGAIRYSLDGQTFQTSNIFTGLAGGNYTISVSDETGCTEKKDVTLADKGAACHIYVPDAFSPNHDGINDYFRFTSGQTINYTVSQFVIYDRWGEVIFVNKNFSILDQTSAWWDGNTRGSQAPAGTYAYYFECVDSSNMITILKGTVLLIR